MGGQDGCVCVHIGLGSICMYMYTCMYTYIYTRIHIYTHVQVTTIAGMGGQSGYADGVGSRLEFVLYRMCSLSNWLR
jgi:hypothetical protein